jgi:hypothetical protein
MLMAQYINNHRFDPKPMKNSLPPDQPPGFAIDQTGAEPQGSPQVRYLPTVSTAT